MRFSKVPKFLIQAIAVTCFSMSGVTGFAQEAQPDCAVRIGGGPKGKVYELMIKDMQTVCGSEVSMCAVPSVGGLPNLMMLSSNQVELGIAQLDTLQVMAGGGDDNIAGLQAVLPLHTNLLHILALRNGSKVGATALPFSGSRSIE